MSWRRWIFNEWRIGRGWFFLDLQKQGIVLICGKQKHHVIARAYAARAYNLEANIHRPVTVKKETMIGRERLAVLLERMDHGAFGFTLHFPEHVRLHAEAASAGRFSGELLQVAQRSGALRL